MKWVLRSEPKLERWGLYLIPPARDFAAFAPGLACWALPLLAGHVRLCPLRPPLSPPPAAFDLSAAALGEQQRLRSSAARSPGAGSPPRPLHLGGEKLHFHLHPSIFLSALELFLEPKGRKGRDLTFLPPLCSCPFIPLFPAAANGFACERSHLSIPTPFHLALPKYGGWAALVGDQGGKSAFVRQVSCRASSCAWRSQLPPQL